MTTQDLGAAARCTCCSRLPRYEPPLEVIPGTWRCRWNCSGAAEQGTLHSFLVASQSSAWRLPCLCKHGHIESPLACIWPLPRWHVGALGQSVAATDGLSRGAAHIAQPAVSTGQQGQLNSLGGSGSRFRPMSSARGFPAVHACAWDLYLGANRLILWSTARNCAGMCRLRYEEPTVGERQLWDVLLSRVQRQAPWPGRAHQFRQVSWPPGTRTLPGWPFA